MVAEHFKQMVDTGKYSMYHYMCHVLRANGMPWECHIAIGEFMEELDARSKRPSVSSALVAAIEQVVVTELFGPTTEHVCLNDLLDIDRFVVTDYGFTIAMKIYSDWDNRWNYVDEFIAHFKEMK